MSFWYDDADRLPRCHGIVLMDRHPSGGRGGLSAPRQCRRASVDGSDYCETHGKAADLQDLYRQVFVHDWKRRVKRWREAQEKDPADKAPRVFLGGR